MAQMHHDLLALAADISINSAGTTCPINRNTERLAKAPAVIFCKTDYLGRLFYYLRFLKCEHPVVLITGNSDYHVNLTDRPTCVVKWFAENCHVVDPDIVPLPLGIERPGVGRSYRPDLWKLSTAPRDRLAFVCHGDGTHILRPAIRAAYRDAPWVDVFALNTPIEDYAAALKSHRFVFCPPGNGADTHRVWEALHCGCIPIMLSSIMSEYWVRELGLPIFLTDDLLTVTDKDLEASDVVYKGPYPALEAEYWITLARKELEWATL